MTRVRHHTINFVVRHELIGCIKDKDYTNTDLNKWCVWAIGEYDTEVIDLIINLPDFVVDNDYIKVDHVNRFIFFNSYKRFKFFIDKIDEHSIRQNTDGSTYALMKDIC